MFKAKTSLRSSIVTRVFSSLLFTVFGCGQAELSQPDHKVVFSLDAKVPMRDGVQLSADVYRPDAPGPFPTLMLMTAYNNMRPDVVRRATYFAQRGYAAVVVDLRGRHDSEGIWHPYVNDPQDGFDTQKWLAEQDWCNGKIGTFGHSYDGFTQVMPARYQHPNLKALMPSANQETNFGHLYNDGIPQLNVIFVAEFLWVNRGMAFWPGIFDHPLMDWNEIFSRLPLYTALDKMVDHAWVKTLLDHPTYDDYWKSYGTKGKYDKILVPAYFLTGWYDNLEHEIWRQFVGFRKEGGSELARKQTKILVGPWSHSYNQTYDNWVIDFGESSLLDVEELHVRWYDFWLKDIPNGIDQEAPIRLFVMRANKWRDEHEWPLARTQWTRYYLNSGGAANTGQGDGTLGTSPPPAGAPQDTFQYDPANPVPTVGGQTEFPPDQRGPQDRRPVQKRDDVLIYSSEPLTQKLEVTGPIELKLYAASSAVDTDFTAVLTEVLPDGTAVHISEGIRRASFRESLENPTLIEPGKVYEIPIEIWETSWEFQPGSRIRLEISSSNFPRFARNLNTGNPLGKSAEMKVATQTIYHDDRYPSHVVLPVIPD